MYWITLLKAIYRWHWWYKSARKYPLEYRREQLKKTSTSNDLINLMICTTWPWQIICQSKGFWPKKCFKHAHVFLPLARNYDARFHAKCAKCYRAQDIRTQIKWKCYLSVFFLPDEWNCFTILYLPNNMDGRVNLSLMVTILWENIQTVTKWEKWDTTCCTNYNLHGGHVLSLN